MCKQSIKNCSNLTLALLEHAMEMISRRCAFINVNFSRPYQAIQLVAVSSGGGTIPLYRNSFSVAP